jgi:geranylgeranyl diphosphate synthase type II
MNTFFSEQLELINRKMKDHFAVCDNNLLKSMFYSLEAGGKRLRPLLVAASAIAIGKDPKQTLDFALALECIHTYSLIHDDLPGMDNADLRRGVPTNHKKFGEGIAILAGDALLTEAFKIVADMDVPSAGKVAAISMLSECAGEKGMCGGQLLDLEMEGQKLSVEDLISVSKLKTGALIKASVLGPALLFQDESSISPLTEYAKNIGVAFQMVDDVLDIVGDEKLTGKKAGADEKNDKYTFPILVGLDETKKRISEYYNNSITVLKPFGENGKYLAGIAQKIVERDR